MPFFRPLVSLSIILSLSACQNTPISVPQGNAPEVAQTPSSDEAAQSAMNVKTFADLKVTLNFDHLSPEDQALAKKENYTIRIQPVALPTPSPEETPLPVALSDIPTREDDPNYEAYQKRIDSQSFDIYPQWSFSGSAVVFSESGTSFAGSNADSTWVLRDLPVNRDFELSVTASVPRYYEHSCSEVEPKVGFSYSKTERLTQGGMTEMVIRPQRFVQVETDDMYALFCNTPFTGQVFDSAGLALANVKITARSLYTSVPFEKETTTNAEGRFNLTLPAGVEVEFIASKSGYSTQTQTYVVQSNLQGDPGVNQLVFGESVSSIALEKIN